MKTSKKKQTKKEIEETKQEKEKADKMEENNPRVNSLRKRAFKSKQKEQRKQGMLSLKCVVFIVYCQRTFWSHWFYKEEHQYYQYYHYQLIYSFNNYQLNYLNYQKTLFWFWNTKMMHPFYSILVWNGLLPIDYWKCCYFLIHSLTHSFINFTGKRGVEIEKSKMADSDDDYDINQAL